MIHMGTYDHGLFSLSWSSQSSQHVGSVSPLLDHLDPGADLKIGNFKTHDGSSQVELILQLLEIFSSCLQPLIGNLVGYRDHGQAGADLGTVKGQGDQLLVHLRIGAAHHHQTMSSSITYRHRLVAQA